MSARSRTPLLVVAALATAKLLLHLLTASNYGPFRDELYFLACGRHLAWGYVDLPPFAALLGWVADRFLPHTLRGLHLIPALAGTARIVVTALLVHELGGRSYAQLIAGLAGIAAGIYLVADGYLSMNSVEPLLWLAGAWVVLRLVRSGNPRGWLAFGAIAGLGMMNKLTMALFIAGAVLGVLLSPARRLLFTRWAVIGGGLAALIFLPHLVWMALHGFPMLEALANISANHRNVSLTPLQFLRDVTILVHPLSLPLWLAGWASLALRERGRYLPLATIFPVALGLLLLTEGRTYYLAPAFPLLFAAGAVAVERGLDALRRRASPALAQGLAGALAGTLCLGGLVTLPLYLPVLPPETLIRYAQVVPWGPPQFERRRDSPLHQLFADRLGWREMAEAAAGVYRALPPEEQALAAIFCTNYGQAGAIDYYGPELGLPAAISGHMNYYLWGPGDQSGAVVITLGADDADLRRTFTRVERAISVGHPYAVPDEHFTIYVCRGLAGTLQEVWPATKHYE